MNKKKWIILISAVVAVALIAVLLVVILGGKPSNGQAGNESTPGTSNIDDVQSDPEKTPETEEDEVVVDVDIDLDEEKIDDSMVIDFDDLLEAAGK